MNEVSAKNRIGIVFLAEKLIYSTRSGMYIDYFKVVKLLICRPLFLLIYRLQ